MKQAPLRGLRCRPGDSVGMKSGMRVGLVMSQLPGAREWNLYQSATDSPSSTSARVG